MVHDLWSPTTGLPPLAKIAGVDSSTLALALQNFRNLYWPTSTSIPQALTSKSQVRHKKLPINRIRNDEIVPDSGYASADDDEEGGDEGEANASSPPANCRLSRANSIDVDSEDEIAILRSDALERAYAIKWAIGFVSRSATWLEATDGDDTDARFHLVDVASQILSAFSGVEPEDEEAAAITRTFSFALESPGSILNVQLNDAALLSEDHTSVGLQSWGSAIILAERICRYPSQFGLVCPSSNPTRIRVLELGAGTGLLSIVAAKILLNSSTVISTDYHPDVLTNLSINVTANFTPPSIPVSVHKLDWESPVYEDPFDEPFDVILAADVIYDPHHAQWIHDCVEQLLAKHTAGEESGGAFWLLIPIRSIGRHEGLCFTVDAIFPDARCVREGGTCWTLAVLRKEEIQRQSSGVGRVDESGYRLFKIGWVEGRVVEGMPNGEGTARKVGSL